MGFLSIYQQPNDIRILSYAQNTQTQLPHVTMISSYFQLTLLLLRTYTEQRFSKDIKVDVDTEQFAKWTVESRTITISEIAADSTLVNFVQGLNAENVVIPWKDWNVKLPLELVSLELADKFAIFLDSKLDPPIVRQQPQKSERERSEPELAAPTLQQKVYRKPNDMPDFDDEYEMLGRTDRPPGPPPGLAPIGDRDLNPPGLPRDPLMKPYIDPLSSGEGGMHPTRDHPLFGRRQQNTLRLGVPPGARFDDPFGESNLDDMGMGLPGNLRGPGGPGGPGSSGGFGNFGNFGPF